MVGLRNHESVCDKNPGHTNFIPVDKFNIDHLPPGCQDEDLVDYVRALSDLTVHVSVKYVSGNRPEIVKDRPYPFYDRRGSSVMRVGTGYVRSVKKYQDEENPPQTCPCPECRISPEPKSQFAEIHILTAAHLIYDDQEAAHATCHLFFDKGGSVHSCPGVVSLNGMSVVQSEDTRDLREIIHVTHDLDIVDKIERMLKHFEDLKMKVNNNFKLETETEKTEMSEQESSAVEMNPVAIIVSHPHACSKQISVGECVEVVERNGDLIPLRYTAATCPGSAGASVLLVKPGTGVFVNDVVHSGTDILDGHCINCSSENKN